MGGYKIVIVSADDWEALYVNGECHTQHHSVYDALGDVINEYKVFSSFERKSLNADGIDWCEDNGSLPERLSEINERYFD